SSSTRSTRMTVVCARAVPTKNPSFDAKVLRDGRKRTSHSGKDAHWRHTPRFRCLLWPTAMSLQSGQAEVRRVVPAGRIGLVPIAPQVLDGLPLHRSSQHRLAKLVAQALVANNQR